MDSSKAIEKKNAPTWEGMSRQETSSAVSDAARGCGREHAAEGVGRVVPFGSPVLPEVKKMIAGAVAGLAGSDELAGLSFGELLERRIGAVRRPVTDAQHVRPFGESACGEILLALDVCEQGARSAHRKSMVLMPQCAILR